MTLGPIELDEIVSEARAVAAEAAALLLAGLGKATSVAHKGEVDLVTEYDRRAEALIVERLRSRFPSFAVRAEESGVHGDAAAPSVWLVDPLDGTTNFSRGHPVFAVSLGLEHREELVAGVVAAPALVARGVYDGYFEPRLHPWDVAAGAVIVAEAGGRVTDYDGAPLDPALGWIAASNGTIHDEMLALIREARSTLP